jgi:hypothetical protein
MRLSEVLDGGSVTVRARRFGASRQSVHPGCQSSSPWERREHLLTRTRSWKE